MKRWPVMTSFGLFIAVCMSAAYWAMQLFKPPLRPVTAPLAVTAPAINLEAASRLLGGRTTAVAVASNFQLKGVVVANRVNESLAIIGTDNQPTRPVTIHTDIVPGVTLKEVHPQYILLSDHGIDKRVALPDNTKLSVNTQGHDPLMPGNMISLPQPTQPFPPAPGNIAPAGFPGTPAFVPQNNNSPG
jgi:general secretion pathway protein C